MGIRSTVKSALLRYSGLSALRWNRLGNNLYCFNYHRIGDRESTQLDPNVFSCTAENFAAQLEFIKDNFQVLSLEELRELKDQGGTAGRKLALITFDDGYIDNYTEALPALRAHGLPAVFFVSTDFVGSGKLPWWDRVAWWVRHCSSDQVSISSLGLDVRLGQGNGVDRSIRDVLNALKAAPLPLDEGLSLLEEALSPTASPTEDEEAVLMDWDHLRALNSEGMAIGSHTCAHKMLAQLEDDEIRSELVESKAKLDEALGSNTIALAYPVGTEGSYDQRAMRIAAELGYELAFNFTEHGNSLPLGNALDISRLAIESDMDLAGLRYKLGGLREK